jgi:hypothetical protein
MFKKNYGTLLTTVSNHCAPDIAPPPPHPQEMPHEVLCTSEELCTPSSFLDVVREVGTEIHAMQLMIKLPAQLIC